MSRVVLAVFVGCLGAIIVVRPLMAADLRSPRDVVVLGAFGGALAFAAAVVLKLVAGVLCGLRVSTVELGVGRIVFRRYTRWLVLTVRWLPIRFRVDWWPNRTVRLSRLRIALP